MVTPLGQGGGGVLSQRRRRPPGHLGHPGHPQGSDIEWAIPPSALDGHHGLNERNNSAVHDSRDPDQQGKAQLAQYEGYASALQTANGVAAKAFVDAGGNPSTTQLAPVVTTYGSALNLYDFQLHFINWPASMRSAITFDHAQLKALMSFLQSFSIVTPTGMSTWLVDLHNRAGTTQGADNVVAETSGCPVLPLFP